MYFFVMLVQTHHMTVDCYILFIYVCYKILIINVFFINIKYKQCSQMFFFSCWDNIMYDLTHIISRTWKQNIVCDYKSCSNVTMCSMRQLQLTNLPVRCTNVIFNCSSRNVYLSAYVYFFKSIVVYHRISSQSICKVEISLFLVKRPNEISC